MERSHESSERVGKGRELDSPGAAGLGAKEDQPVKVIFSQHTSQCSRMEAQGGRGHGGAKFQNLVELSRGRGEILRRDTLKIWETRAAKQATLGWGLKGEGGVGHNTTLIPRGLGNCVWRRKKGKRRGLRPGKKTSRQIMITSYYRILL